MDLKQARSNLTNLLSDVKIADVVVNNPDVIFKAMDEWFIWYKAWEKTDTDFYAIWRDKRMFVRSIGLTDSNYATLQAKKPGFQEWQDKGWGAAKGDEIKTHEFVGVSYNTGRDGILKRLEPEKFINRGTGKYKTAFAEGLMEVSGTILRPDKKLSMQLHVKPEAGHWQAFVPLSAEEDQELLLFISDKFRQVQTVIGKDSLGLTQLTTKLKDIRAKVTRLKLAFETDQALGFVAIPSGEGDYRKFKYIVKSQVKYSMNNPNPLLRNKTVAASKDLAALLRNNVKRYKSCVGIAVKNEVSVAIRKHENPKWPMFVQWTGKDREDDSGRWDIYKKVGEEWQAANEYITNICPL